MSALQQESVEFWLSEAETAERAGDTEIAERCLERAVAVESGALEP